MNEIIDNSTLCIEHCPNCGIAFAIPENYQQRRRRDHKTFYCPSGHTQYYPQESDIDKAKRETSEAKKEADRLKQCVTHKKELLQRTEYQVRHFKGEVTKLKRKIK